jgi:hemerythrin superfamily protein
MAARGRLGGEQHGDRTLLRASAMLAHHEHIEQLLARIVEAVLASEGQRARAQIEGLRRELLDHFEAEETFILPKLREAQREAATVLLGEHDQLRALLDELGADAAVGSLAVEQVRRFAGRLKEHSTREEALLYPWAREKLGDWVWAKIARQITPAPTRTGNA